MADEFSPRGRSLHPPRLGSWRRQRRWRLGRVRERPSPGGP
jgi:hypothetical protein